MDAHVSLRAYVANGSKCYDADYYPGVYPERSRRSGERAYVSTRPQNYKFTGKERDPESGVDDFEARYNSSSLGRFMTPDWSARPAGIPYATLTNPQSLNLYSYVLDNPVTRLDPDGHAGLHAGDEPYAGFGDEERGMYEAAFDPGAASALGEIFTQTQLDAANQGQQQDQEQNQAQQQGTIPGTAQPPALHPPKPPADALKLTEYPTRDAAGMEAEKRINPTSIKEDREYAGWLIKNPDGTYSIGHPNPGTENGSDPGPKPNNAAGEYHTHGGPSPGAEVFSPRDKYSLTKTWGVTGYLGTPSGRILRFDPSTQRTTVLAWPD